MEPSIDHIQITVRDMAVAVPFYDRLMPVLGFDPRSRSAGRVEAHDFDVVEYVHPRLCIGINSPRAELQEERIHRRRPGALHHLAFRVNSCSEVDDVYEKLVEIEVPIVSEPCYWPQHGKSYYACFFKDLEGIKYEIVYEDKTSAGGGTT